MTLNLRKVAARQRMCFCGSLTMGKLARAQSPPCQALLWTDAWACDLECCLIELRLEPCKIFAPPKLRGEKPQDLIAVSFHPHIAVPLWGVEVELPALVATVSDANLVAVDEQPRAQDRHTGSKVGEGINLQRCSQDDQEIALVKILLEGGLDVRSLREENDVWPDGPSATQPLAHWHLALMDLLLKAVLLTSCTTANA
eukprot:CAMPEP_0180708398 /NCGR_PEP_ID=MMETSP1038_2-20121128/9221_1 /TAXON_ID=632150 /ORGANISM="Azadinium spinosum, Strain 3D9" /LENGTH=198 /DNA_ID=CAMNT_0022740401 /DNA_START=390 /DNA_END=987 /DNA_ORIENTATION=-